MKRFVLVALLVAAAGLSLLPAQSLVDNSYFKRSIELRGLADKSFEDGDYDAAADYAAQAQEYAGLSDKFVEKMVAMGVADKAIATARAKGSTIDASLAGKSWPKEYSAASEAFDSALTAYKAEDFQTAAAKADEASALWDSLRAAILAAQNTGPVTAASLALPARYTVRLIPARRDCLWRIAEYPFIYNNPLKWTVIYEANKKTFKDPSNPNLIFPGQVLQIPTLRGETRDGTYDPTKDYPTFPRK